MKIKTCSSASKDVFVVLEHDLSVSVWVQQRQEVHLMHLLHELAHV